MVPSMSNSFETDVNICYTIKPVNNFEIESSQEITCKGVSLLVHSESYKEEFTLIVNNLTLVPSKLLCIQSNTTLLNEVSFFGQSGRVLGIITSAGCCDAALLNAIAGRTSSMTLTGDILVISNVSSHYITDANVATKTRLFTFSFVGEHDDHLLPHLTVSESLHYVAELKFPFKSVQERNFLVDDIINKMGLNRCRAVLVGDVNKRGISTGERRRLLLSMELLNSEQSIIILHHVTTGLDIIQARATCQLLQLLAKEQNKLIICSLHQPTAELLNEVDDLLCLHQGTTVFFGPVKDFPHYVETILHYKTPPDNNIIDYFLDHLSEDVYRISNSVTEYTNASHHLSDIPFFNSTKIMPINAIEWTNTFKTSSYNTTVMLKIHTLMSQEQQQSKKLKNNLIIQRNIDSYGLWKQLVFSIYSMMIITRRFFKNTVRNRMAWIPIIIALSQGLLLGCITFRYPSKFPRTQTTIQEPLFPNIDQIIPMNLKQFINSNNRISIPNEILEFMRTGITGHGLNPFFSTYNVSSDNYLKVLELIRCIHSTLEISKRAMYSTRYNQYRRHFNTTDQYFDHLKHYQFIIQDKDTRFELFKQKLSNASDNYLTHNHGNNSTDILSPLTTIEYYIETINYAIDIFHFLRYCFDLKPVFECLQTNSFDMSLIQCLTKANIPLLYSVLTCLQIDKTFINPLLKDQCVNYLQADEDVRPFKMYSSVPLPGLCQRVSEVEVSSKYCYTVNPSESTNNFFLKTAGALTKFIFFRSSNKPKKIKTTRQIIIDPDTEAFFQSINPPSNNVSTHFSREAGSFLYAVGHLLHITDMFGLSRFQSTSNTVDSYNTNLSFWNESISDIEWKHTKETFQGLLPGISVKDAIFRVLSPNTTGDLTQLPYYNNLVTLWKFMQHMHELLIQNKTDLDFLKHSGHNKGIYTDLQIMKDELNQEIQKNNITKVEHWSNDVLLKGRNNKTDTSFKNDPQFQNNIDTDYECILKENDFWNSIQGAYRYYILQQMNKIKNKLLIELFPRIFMSSWISLAITGVLYATTVNLSFFSLQAVFAFHKERVLFNRESANGLYSSLAFCLGKTLSDLPIHLIAGLSLTSTWALLSGIPTLPSNSPFSILTQFILHLCIAVLLCFTAHGFCYMISAATPRVEIALVLAPGIMMIWVILAGFILRNDTMLPSWLRWFRYISMHRYAFFAFLQNQFPSNLMSGELSNISVLWLMGSSRVSIVYNLTILFLLGVAFRIVGFFFLKLAYRSVGLTMLR